MNEEKPKENKNNRLNMPKPEGKPEEKQNIKVEQVLETAKAEAWTLEKLGAELEKIKFNPDDIADKLAKKLLMIFQESDKQPELETKTEPEIVKPTEPTEPNKPKNKSIFFK